MIILSFSIWGCTEYEINLDIEDYLKTGFYINDAIDVRDEYFDGFGYPIGFVTTDVDFSDQEAQTKMQ